VLYLNDGDWVEHCTALTEDHTGAMELIHWSEQPTALGRASRELLMPSPTAAASPWRRWRHVGAVWKQLRPAA
jgi:hypothetical protein